MDKNKLIEVYKDTMSVAAKRNFSKPLTTKYFNDFDYTKFPPATLNNISVLGMDSVSAIVKYKDTDVCVLNMASYKRPGGGVLKGSKAQEECLFRCSNLGSVDETHLYPLQDDSALYTERAIFFKDFHYNLMEPIECDVVTVAAFNFNTRESTPPKFKDYEGETKDKIRLMLTLASEHEVQTLILGSWGCGVFKNDPTKMATMFKEVLVDEGFTKSFDRVIFAIINDHNSVDDNYSIFKKLFT